MRDVVRRESEQITNSRRCCDADGIALIPAASAEPGRIVQAGKSFIDDQHRSQEPFAVDMRRAAESQKRAQTIARMPAWIAVVEIEITDHCRVDKRRSLGGQILTEAENPARIFSRRLSSSQSSADFRRLTIVSAKSTANGIEQTLRRRVNCFVGKICKPGGSSLIGNCSSDPVHNRMGV